MDAPKPKRRLYGARGTTTLTNSVLWSLIRSFDQDEWSNDDDLDYPYYMTHAEDIDDDGEFVGTYDSDEEDIGESGYLESSGLRSD